MPPPLIPWYYPTEMPYLSAILLPLVSAVNPVLPVSMPMMPLKNLPARWCVPMTLTNLSQLFIPPSVSRPNTAAYQQSTAQAPFIHLLAQQSVPITLMNLPQQFIPPLVLRLNTITNWWSTTQGHRTPFILNSAWWHLLMLYPFS